MYVISSLLPDEELIPMFFNDPEVQQEIFAPTPPKDAKPWEKKLEKERKINAEERQKRMNTKAASASTSSSSS